MNNRRKSVMLTLVALACVSVSVENQSVAQKFKIDLSPPKIEVPSLPDIGEKLEQAGEHFDRKRREAQQHVEGQLRSAFSDNYETNKFKLKAQVEQGGWHVAWADDIAEKDVAAGCVAVGVSVSAGNPKPFVAWLKYLVDRTVVSMVKSGRRISPQVERQIRDLAARAIRDAILGQTGRELTRNFDGIGVKAGAIRYSGANKFVGNTVTRTWGIKPYIAIRLARPAPASEQASRFQLVQQRPKRTRFIGQRSRIMFEAVRPGQWVARNTTGHIIGTFREAERNGAYVGLHSTSSFPHVRLYPEHVRELRSGSNQWVPGERGSWVR